jgi:hypothetical protein
VFRPGLTDASTPAPDGFVDCKVAFNKALKAGALDDHRRLVLAVDERDTCETAVANSMKR